MSQVDTSVQGKQQATTERMKANTGLQPEKQNQSADEKKLEQLCINTIRTLSMDAVQKANSGHPGTPMALAPLAFVLWDRYLRFNPRNPHWAGRDRFILSNGHASMLLYSMLHLTGYDLLARRHQAVPPVEFQDSGPSGIRAHARRGNHDRTAGAGCGELRRLCDCAALAGRQLDKDVFDWRTYVFCGDGDMMEGVSNEAASVAGHLGLSNLIWFYDNNHITIEGNTSLAFSDDVATRFMWLALECAARQRRE